jgi:hypothetical protein
LHNSLAQQLDIHGLVLLDLRSNAALPKGRFAVDSTTLNLLTRDGVVTVLVIPALEADHYAELHTKVCDVETADELREVVKAACDRWGRTVHFG